MIQKITIQMDTDTGEVRISRENLDPLGEVSLLQLAMAYTYKVITEKSVPNDTISGTTETQAEIGGENESNRVSETNSPVQQG